MFVNVVCVIHIKLSVKEKSIWDEKFQLKQTIIWIRWIFISWLIEWKNMEWRVLEPVLHWEQQTSYNEDKTGLHIKWVIISLLDHKTGLHVKWVIFELGCTLS